MPTSPLSKMTQEDLFEGTSMSFGDHLEELRVALFRSLIGVIVACLFTMCVAERIVNFFQAPLTKAMETYQQQRAEKRLAAELGVETLPPEMKQLVRDRGLVPETVRVETRSFLKHLNGELGGTRFSSIHPQHFVMSELAPVNTAALASSLVSAGSAEEASRAKRLWLLCTPEDQATLKTLAKETEVTAESRLQLLGILNRLIELPAWSDSEEFKASQDVPEVAAVQKLRDGAVVTGESAAKIDAQQELHRLLIAGTFPKEVPTTVPLLELATFKRLDVKFTVLNAQEAFMIWMKAGIVAGLVLASPWIFYQIWLFVAAGLYPHEKNQVYIYLPISTGLFLAGASLAFCFVFQPVLDFLFSFNDSLNAEFQPRIGEWLSFVLIMPIGFGVSFQLPLVMLLLNRIGVVSIELFIQQWRIAVLIIFVAAMVLTPSGDPISMLLMAVPLCLLYVLGIGMCKYMPRASSPFSEAYEP